MVLVTDTPEGSSAVGAVDGRLLVVAMGMEQLPIGRRLGATLAPWTAVVDLQQLSQHGEGASTPGTPPALPFEQVSFARG